MSEFSPICIYFLPIVRPIQKNCRPTNVVSILSGDARSRFDIRFYLVSILFIFPDPEVTFSFLWEVHPNKIDPFGSWSMMAFLLILTIVSLYELKRGASDRE